MVAASRKRRVLALYVDLMLFTALWQSCAWWLVERAALPVPWYLSVLLFVLLQAALLGLWRDTPGRRVLGMTRVAEGALVVSPALLARERWWTLLLGMLGLLEGAKELVRFTQGLPPPPFMGQTLSWDQAAAVVTTSGLLMMAASLGVLRGRSWAALLGMLLTGLTLLSWLLSASQVAAWVDARTLAARAMQGVAVRPGELATMRKVLPGGAMFGSAVGTLWLLAAWRRFRALDRQ